MPEPSVKRVIILWVSSNIVVILPTLMDIMVTENEWLLIGILGLKGLSLVAINWVFRLAYLNTVAAIAKEKARKEKKLFDLLNGHLDN